MTETKQVTQFAEDVLLGLSSVPKSLSSKYFYDDIGSEIFQKITAHEDYYLTRSENEILATIQPKLPILIPADAIDVIELGGGDGHKSDVVLQGFLQSGRQVNYFPIDISEKAFQLMEPNITPHANLSFQPVCADYETGLLQIRERSSNPQLLLFLGSNIGNFNYVDRLRFLQRIQDQLQSSSYMLIGFDLKKDISRLNRAYNDSAGLTREFNLNLLHRMNRELEMDFDLSQFSHYGMYNPELGAMESYLLSTKEQWVYSAVFKEAFRFDAFEPMHVENSFKFLRSDIDRLSQKCGFKVLDHFTDKNDYFIDSLWQVT